MSPHVSCQRETWILEVCSKCRDIKGGNTHSPPLTVLWHLRTKPNEQAPLVQLKQIVSLEKPSSN